MSDWRERLGRITAFLGREIGRSGSHRPAGKRLRLRRLLQFAQLVGREFFVDHCLLRASALTYSTLLAIVPLLALMFAVLKGLGVQNVLEPLILERLAVGSEEIVSAIIRYINNTNVGQIGVAGLLMLVVSVLALLSNIEESFNHIWGVEETRTLYRRFADYFSVVAIGPIFLLVAITMTTTLESQTVVQLLLGLPYVGLVVVLLFQVLPFVMMWAAFTGLYIFMPNTRVNLRAALAGGVFAGTLWQAAQWTYVNFQIGVARYNAIYGTLAAVPIFMVWIYVSWVIALLGLEVTYGVQNRRTLRREVPGEAINFASRELAALTVLLCVAEAFYRGEKPRTLENLSVALELPPRLTRALLNDLVRLGFLVEVRDGDGDEGGFQPSRAPQTVELHAVVTALREEGASYLRLRKTPEREVVRQLEERLREAGRQSLGGATLDDLVRQMAERGKA
jgi:membrane protein